MYSSIKAQSEIGGTRTCLHKDTAPPHGHNTTPKDIQALPYHIRGTLQKDTVTPGQAGESRLAGGQDEVHTSHNKYTCFVGKNSASDRTGYICIT